jgi:cation diffusion facilitator family transporter
MSEETTSPVDRQKLEQLEKKQQGSLNWQFPISNFTVVSDEQVSSKKKAVREFYEQQNEKILQWQHLAVEHHLSDDEDSLLSPTASITEEDLVTDGNVTPNRNDKVPLTSEDAQEDMEQDARGVSKYWRTYEQWCIHGSFWINVCLFCLKVAGAVTSMSLSVITSALDSFLDLLSGLILYITNRISKKAKKDRYAYPMGKSRLEPLGFIIFAAVMATAALQIVRQGIQDIIQGFINGEPFIRTNGVPVGGQFLGFGNKTLEKIFFYAAIVVLGFTAMVKGTLWQICKRCKHSPSVQAYAFDHRNDLLTNSLLLCGVFVSRWLWWIDALIAVILSCYIIYSWIMQSMEHIVKLVGRVAETEFLQKVTYIAMNHHKSVLKVDTVQAWYLGMNMYVEVDIVLPEDMSLREAHDIGEQLQLKIEKLPDVERCYVHLDYEYEHSKCDEHVPAF